MTAPELRSALTCPQCGHRHDETMPTDYCRWFYECKHSHVVLRPVAGDCVFFSYGSAPRRACRSSVQIGGDCCR